MGGGPKPLLAPPNENLGGPVPLVSTGSGPHVLPNLSFCTKANTNSDALQRL